MLTQQQLATMLSLQDKMNTKVNAEWLTAGYGYLRAAMVESVEAIEHHGWKWWKAQKMDLPQLQMEMVDIWHFALSACIIDYRGDVHAAANALSAQLAQAHSHVKFDSKDYYPEHMDLLDNLELMAGLCAAKRFSVPLFMHIITLCEMSSDDLYQQYVGKNILNFFRQDHGYKDGTYIKVWSDREDNEHLVEVLAELDMDAADYDEQVYAGLKARYPQ
ncbi:dUTP diphosphatase [Alteromonas aestuariivivens]|uniref:dUTP diphosphatase n=1 Tax=Alteromonas aestuariivivens TaxID=1938339 RepID=A0A3D8M3Z2_9ALTE|nr:dUTP diphosphatase [Alteromonas aestuariivivens]RDV24467.1 dUTP diphosphatase [Alteromonas aestuariivivens]